MKKNKKILIVMFVAILCAVIACVGIFMVLSPQRTTLYVFNDSYTTGTQVTSQMLTPIQVDSTLIVAGGATNISNRFVTADEYRSVIQSGESLRLDVSAGMPLMTSMLSVTGGNDIEMSMRADAIAVTVSVNSVTGITNDLNAGSRVNVYVTYSTGTELLLENMRILSISKSSSNALATATLEVSNNDALKLIEAQTRGNIHLGLVNSTGYKSVYENQEQPEDIVESTIEPTQEQQPEQPAEQQPEQQPAGTPETTEEQPAA